MRCMDVLLAFLVIILALAIVSVLGASLNNVIIAVAIFSVPVFARIVRGSTLAVKNLEYIDAIKVLGASDGRNYLYNAPHVAFFPGMAIVVVVLAFNILGDGLRDALDPKMKD